MCLYVISFKNVKNVSYFVVSMQHLSVSESEVFYFVVSLQHLNVFRISNVQNNVFYFSLILKRSKVFEYDAALKCCLCNVEPHLKFH